MTSVYTVSSETGMKTISHPLTWISHYFETAKCNFSDKQIVIRLTLRQPPSYPSVGNAGQSSPGLWSQGHDINNSAGINMMCLSRKPTESSLCWKHLMLTAIKCWENDTWYVFDAQNGIVSFYLKSLTLLFLLLIIGIINYFVYICRFCF